DAAGGAVVERLALWAHLLGGRIGVPVPPPLVVHRGGPDGAAGGSQSRPRDARITWSLTRSETNRSTGRVRLWRAEILSNSRDAVVWSGNFYNSVQEKRGNNHGSRTAFKGTGRVRAGGAAALCRRSGGYSRQRATEVHQQDQQG